MPRRGCLELVRVRAARPCGWEAFRSRGDRGWLCSRFQLLPENILQDHLGDAPVNRGRGRFSLGLRLGIGSQNDGARSVTAPDFSRRCHRDVRECRRGSRFAAPLGGRLHSRARVGRRGQIPALSCAGEISYTYYKPSGLGLRPRPGRLFFSHGLSVAKNP